MFNILSTKTLNHYILIYPEAANALRKLYKEIEKSDFENFNELKTVYGNASIVGDNRVIFNILGNKYRLIVRVNFQHKRMMIKWFGTHQEYDKIDANTIEYIYK
ncbi:type II toxin-antitoxin system HigB family toxin [Runella sp. MFBS21]|uniref:type II toxin-antitoxin system HigB family toxin n=1 Tax=Runella sp. MFBS21 TaxID=3034018 RepID=UPI0023F7A5AE|nr:type II toxin-antitoxin system HigB family toxin [Runella sp. MFBS21]MDF7820743.1 type II toxin-antitoxin system HigB family toxin [Runella sp. MFBS21]